MIGPLENKTPPKYSVEIKQKENGEWYLASIKINSDSDEELFDSLNLSIEGINRTLERLNSSRIQIATKASERIVPVAAEKSKLKERSPRKPPEEIILTPEEGRLYDTLRGLRDELAIRDNCPTYMVMPNATLKLMAKNKPETREEMLKISGIGEKRFEHYGKDFIKLIQDFKALSNPSGSEAGGRLEI